MNVETNKVHNDFNKKINDSLCVLVDIYYGIKGVTKNNVNRKYAFIF